MASSENLIKIFKAFKDNNQVDFTKVAYEIIEDEKRKNHNLLANKLNKILFEDNYSVKINNKSNINNSQLPVDKESGIQLLDMKFSKTMLDDVIIDKSNKKKIDEIIVEFKNKELLHDYKLTPKTRILFCGPPGCGKTMTVEGIANELELPLLYTRFDSVISSFLGETSSNLRKIFDFSKNGEWILFFDEFDALGKSRGSNNENGELSRVVNSFLQLMDNSPRDMMIIAATNYETMIDKALWRRFDEIIYFDKPKIEEIELTIKRKLRNFSFSNLDLKEYSRMMDGFSYADIERVCMESAKYCIINNISGIENSVFKEMVENQNLRLKLVNGCRE